MADDAHITPRQLECLRFAAQGMTSLEIARALKIKAKSVDAYITEACHRLGVRNRTQAVAKATAAGWL